MHKLTSSMGKHWQQRHTAASSSGLAASLIVHDAFAGPKLSDIALPGKPLWTSVNFKKKTSKQWFAKVYLQTTIFDIFSGTVQMATQNFIMWIGSLLKLIGKYGINFVLLVDFYNAANWKQMEIF